MYGEAIAQVIATYFRGWNGQHGNWHRCWCWLEYLGDGWYQVRWRGMDFAENDGRLTVRGSVEAVDRLCELLNSPEVVGKWREIPA